MGITPTVTTLTVTTAGTATRATADATITPSTVYFEALQGNTANIYIGVAGVTSSTYIACLIPGQGFTMGVDAHAAVRMGPADIQLSNLYVQATTSGDKVNMTTWLRMGT